LTVPKLSDHISGAILYDETIRQSTKTGVPFTKVMLDNGILPGIKVDKGPQPLAGFPGEVVTEGLDGLRDRLKEYAKLGAKFAKWRAVIAIGEDMPSSTCIEATILKASMVISGKDCPEQADVDDVAEATLRCLKAAVPAILPGIVFLSGGQSDEAATAHLNAMNTKGPNPWPLSFSYGRAMQ